MEKRASVFWTCVLVASLLVESCHAQKLNVHWGPQSMMYLKGKHGRRFVSQEDSGAVPGLQGWYAVLRGIQKLQSQDFRKPGPLVSADRVLVRFLQEM
ncbi:spexin prohormone 2-like [Clinocottus analis]|uniref:spexin prohormone 2-like n=1 Tax=Clinocottus analis TaxID=304258 RepID=UPI0035BF74EF